MRAPSRARPPSRGRVGLFRATASPRRAPGTRRYGFAVAGKHHAAFLAGIAGEIEKRWDELGLPKLVLQAPWHGYPLTQWTAENAEEAELAVTGRYYETGEKLAGRREDTE